MKIIKFKEWNCNIVTGLYNNNRTAIQLYDAVDYSPILTATINIPELNLNIDEVVIKNYSENEGILECLIENGIIELTGKQVEVGFSVCEICRIVLPKYEF